MNIQEKLELLLSYYESTRQIGHTNLLKNGTKNTDKKLILAWNKNLDKFFECKKEEIISWNNIKALEGHKSPLVIDNGVMWKLLDESLNEMVRLQDKIKELETRPDRIKQIEREMDNEISNERMFGNNIRRLIKVLRNK